MEKKRALYLTAILCIVIVLVSGVSLAGLTLIRDQHTLLLSDGNSSTIAATAELEGGHDYTVRVDIVNTGAFVSHASGEVFIYVNDSLVLHKVMNDTAISFGRRGTSTRADAYVQYDFTAVHNTTVRVIGRMDQGSTWSVRAFQDLSPWHSTAIAVSGVVLGASGVVGVSAGAIYYVMSRHAKAGATDQERSEGADTTPATSDEESLSLSEMADTE